MFGKNIINNFGGEACFVCLTLGGLEYSFSFCFCVQGFENPGSFASPLVVGSHLCCFVFVFRVSRSLVLYVCMILCVHDPCCCFCYLHGSLCPLSLFLLFYWKEGWFSWLWNGFIADEVAGSIIRFLLFVVISVDVFVSTAPL